MSYVDGYVLAVPTDKKNEYLELAKVSADVFKDHGATQVVENWGEEVPDGKLTSFPMSVNLEEGETVVFSWVTWPSKEIRNKGMQTAMEDPRFEVFKDNIPFDGKRMIFGGFETIVDVS